MTEAGNQSITREVKSAAYNNHTYLSNDSDVSSNMSAVFSALNITYIVITVLGMLGNLLTLIVICTHSPIRNKLPNYYFINQTIVDFLLSILLIPSMTDMIVAPVHCTAYIPPLSNMGVKSTVPQPLFSVGVQYSCSVLRAVCGSSSSSLAQTERYTNKGRLDNSHCVGHRMFSEKYDYVLHLQSGPGNVHPECYLLKQKHEHCSRPFQLFRRFYFSFFLYSILLHSDVAPLANESEIRI